VTGAGGGREHPHRERSPELRIRASLDAKFPDVVVASGLVRSRGAGRRRLTGRWKRVGYVEPNDSAAPPAAAANLELSLLAPAILF